MTALTENTLRSTKGSDNSIETSSLVCCKGECVPEASNVLDGYVPMISVLGYLGWSGILK